MKERYNGLGRQDVNEQVLDLGKEGNKGKRFLKVTKN